jgi:hypothetical protein
MPAVFSRSAMSVTMSTQSAASRKRRAARRRRHHQAHEQSLFLGHDEKGTKGVRKYSSQTASTACSRTRNSPIPIYPEEEESPKTNVDLIGYNVLIDPCAMHMLQRSGLSWGSRSESRRCASHCIHKKYSNEEDPPQLEEKRQYFSESSTRQLPPEYLHSGGSPATSPPEHLSRHLSGLAHLPLSTPTNSDYPFLVESKQDNHSRTTMSINDLLRGVTNRAIPISQVRIPRSNLFFSLRRYDENQGQQELNL